MTEREPKTARVDPDVWKQFETFVVRVHGTKRGEMGREVENALEEYMDHDRYARIEDKLDELVARLPESGRDTHTRPSVPDGTAGEELSETVQKAHTIAGQLRQLHDEAVQDKDVTRVIRRVAGSHRQTRKQYRELLKEEGLAFEDPADENPVWYVDRDVFIGRLLDYVDVTGADDHAILKPYPPPVVAAYDRRREERKESEGVTET